MGGTTPSFLTHVPGDIGGVVSSSLRLAPEKGAALAQLCLFGSASLPRALVGSLYVKE